jgi:hypothetical protein
VKLLYLLECELEPEDLRLLASISGRSVIDTLTLVAEVRDGLKRKDEKVSCLRDELDSVWRWIVQRGLAGQRRGLQQSRLPLLARG